MTTPNSFMEQRIAIRDEQLSAISSAARRYGVTAFHVFGSLGRGTADALSDIDAWLTFPDEAIDGVARARLDLFGEVGQILLVHEMTPNRPPGGVYALVLYATSAGPACVDWCLAPQRSLRVGSTARVVFADPPVAVGDQPYDAGADHPVNRSERITWLICMLFVAIKMIVRGGNRDFLPFLANAYRDIGEAYGLEGFVVTEPVSLANVGAMLRQLDRYADETQHTALQAIDGFAAALA